MVVEEVVGVKVRVVPVVLVGVRWAGEEEGGRPQVVVHLVFLL